MEVSRFGDWDRAKVLLTNGFNQRLALAVRQATTKNALLLVREIQRGIRSQAPGGKQFAPLAEVTIERKGSSKALIDTGFLLNSITQKIMSDGAFVGLLRTSVYKNGESIANIGAIMEYGATINHPSGAVIVIPPRPFLHPTMLKYRNEVIENYRQALLSVIR
ncbi:MAG: hypothetical protein GX139_01675 [Armatimonadetes bacterium]|jgi:phage gpG-like protein|nr:hypothetical protein [Armatimonadota bacterium]